MKTQFEQMMDGVADVEAYLGGKRNRFKVHARQRQESRRIIKRKIDCAESLKMIEGVKKKSS